MTDLRNATGADVRKAARQGTLTGPTPGLAKGFVQTNLVILPKDLAFDFLLFCQRNPKPCPVLDVTEPGDPDPRYAAAGADVRTDVPRYRLFRDGQLVAEPTDVRDSWTPDSVAFLLGCSFTFEHALLDAELPVRHIEENKNVPMYRTTIACRAAGRFAGPLVVSMRPMLPPQAARAAEICAHYPQAHGAPIHAGDPSAIGITDINAPNYGDAVTIRDDEIPVFWACGVTPQAALAHAKPKWAVTHAPGHMFVTDLRDSDLRE